jgi:hypothetical protein
VMGVRFRDTARPPRSFTMIYVTLPATARRETAMIDNTSRTSKGEP